MLPEGVSKKTHKRCIKCRKWKLRETTTVGGVEEKAGFGAHESSSDGLQSICHSCKNVMNKKGRDKNTSARLRHHISTRCLAQLGDFAPEGFTRDIEKYLGYRIRRLVVHLRKDLQRREGKKRRLREALNEGYHVDHIRPLSSFPVINDGDIDWDMFQKCWEIGNLSAIPAQDNLQKGAKHVPIDENIPESREMPF